MVSRSSLLVVLGTMVFVPLVPAPVVAQTSGTLYVNSTTKLTADHHGNVEIGTDGVTLDCAGYSIMGDGGDGTVGISGGRLTGVTIENCDVSNFSYGIQLWDSSNSTVHGNTVHDNDFDGVSLVGGWGNVVRDNDSSRNGVGFAVSSGSDSGHTLVGNSALDNDFGFFVVEASGNVLKANYAANNGDGFQLWSSTGNTVKDNLAVDNGAGFVLYDSSQNTIKGNMAGGDGGFFFGDGVLDNELKDNAGCFADFGDHEVTNTFKSNDFSCLT